MNIAIIQFPGSNCERETMLAVKRAGMIPVEFLWNEPVAKLIACDGYIIVGGFSYEDRSRSGIIAALDPVMQGLKTQSELGKPILGICNGAQILVEAGLVPKMALTDNKRLKQGKIVGTGYYNTWVHVTLAKTHRKNAFTRYLDADSVLKIPLAHAEGRFVIPPDVLDTIERNGLAVFQYCNEQGEVIDEFPVNPNGSVNNFAAISNQAGNVMAIMPHPERTTAGDVLLHSMRDYIKDFVPSHSCNRTSRGLSAGSRNLFTLLDRTDKPGDVDGFGNTKEIIVELMINDNHALSVESTLQKNEIPVRIKRQIHWDVNAASDAVISQIKASQLLYNERKEFLVTPKRSAEPGECSLLVRAREDLVGRQVLQKLNDHAGIDGINSIQHGILWTISADPSLLDSLVKKVIETGILFNPVSHECFHYA